MVGNRHLRTLVLAPAATSAAGADRPIDPRGRTGAAPTDTRLRVVAGSGS